MDEISSHTAYQRSSRLLFSYSSH